jgi:DNA helicase-2/ATP-dependent DNA helicase PcrA
MSARVNGTILLPAFHSREEQRRLLYVAMTRAKNELDLIVPQRFYTHNQSRTGDRHVYASVSRFIPDTIYRTFDRQTWQAVSDAGKPFTPIQVIQRQRLKMLGIGPNQQ